MAKNRLCDIEIWKKKWFLELSDKRKLLVKFLFDNCDNAGFYEISWRILNVYFNSEITKEDFQSIKQVRFISEDLIFIEDFVLFQQKIQSLNELNRKNKAHLQIIRLLEKNKILRGFEGACEGLTSPSGIGIGNGIGPTTPQDNENNSSKNLEEKEEIKKEEKEDFSDIKDWHGEYKNVHLTQEQYGKLRSMVLNDEFLDLLINELSENIAQKKEKSPPYDPHFPNMHFIAVKKYWDFRKTHPPNPKAKSAKDDKKLDEIIENARNRSG